MLVPVFCTAKKDPCRQVKRTWDTEKRTHGCESPALTHVTVIKQNKPTKFFVLRFYLKDANEHYNATGAAVEFEDGTTIKNEAATIDCRQEASTLASGPFGSGTHAGEYILQGFFKINEENIEKFTSSKITRIRLSDVAAKINDKEANMILTYVTCMKEMK